MGAPGTTPGPWGVADNGFWIVSGMLSDEKEIARAACGALGYSAERANAHQIAASGALYDALAGMVERYTSLVNCGDCGSWNPEVELEVIAARAALAQARGEVSVHTLEGGL